MADYYFKQGISTVGTSTSGWVRVGNDSGLVEMMRY